MNMKDHSRWHPNEKRSTAEPTITTLLRDSFFGAFINAESDWRDRKPPEHTKIKL